MYPFGLWRHDLISSYFLLHLLWVVSRMDNSSLLPPSSPSSWAFCLYHRPFQPNFFEVGVAAGLLQSSHELHGAAVVEMEVTVAVFVIVAVAVET
jgi:hypothetical protein